MGSGEAGSQGGKMVTHLLKLFPQTQTGPSKIHLGKSEDAPWMQPAVTPGHVRNLNTSGGGAGGVASGRRQGNCERGKEREREKKGETDKERKSTLMEAIPHRQ